MKVMKLMSDDRRERDKQIAREFFCLKYAKRLPSMRDTFDSIKNI